MDIPPRPIRLACTGFLVVLPLLSPSVFHAQKITGISEAELREITDRGHTLAEYDAAAWHGSDAVMALKPETKNLGRYVAKKTDSGWVVAFGQLNEPKDKFLIAYEATQGTDPSQFHVEKLDRPKEDTGFFLFAARSIEVALAAFQAQKRPYNVAVLPASSNQMYLYIVPAPTVAGAYPYGGDVRYLMTADGSAIVEKRQLHKTLLEYKAPQQDATRWPPQRSTYTPTL